MGPGTTEALSKGYGPASMLEFRILGPLEVVAEDGPIGLAGPKQRATLAILLLNANRVVSVEQLADDLYSGAAPVTAVTQVQRQISELRKALGSASAIETRSPGYLIRLSAGQLDLDSFQRRAEEAGRALARGDPQSASDLVRNALDLWRGAPLADFAYESFAQTSIQRLEELRLAAVEQRIDAELALGRHAELVGELQELVAEHPLQERLRGQLMLALYRSGRQADALDVYRATREALVEELAIEPTPALRQLERSILAQESSLDLDRAAASPTYPAEPDRAVLVLPSDDDRLEDLLAIAEPLGALPARELIIARLVTDEVELGRATSALTACRKTLAVPARTAAFTAREPAQDVVRLATTYDVDLVLRDAPARLDADAVPDELAAIMEGSPADVAVLSGSGAKLSNGAGVFVPFGGGEHDWAALELGAWLAFAADMRLVLVGTRGDPRRAIRDATRLLADASLAVQRALGVEAEPRLADPAEGALLDAVQRAALIVLGISSGWRRKGIGATRRALVRRARPPVLLVHRGPRPGGLAPRESRTRFTWSVEG
jgi:DNA-binding SARP family transcriptional activator